MTEASEVVKRSISMSRLVSDWADALANSKGFGSNFSAYIADLVRRDRERENELKLASPGRDTNSLKEAAEIEIERTIRQSARASRSAPRKR